MRLPSVREAEAMYATQDSDAIVDALAYVEQLHQELTTENGAPPLGAQNRVAEAILADPALVAYVRDWAARNHVLEASTAPAQRLPIDDVYRRLGALLLENETPAFG
jgi:transcriptional accessory protein Tex/SPT6